MELENSEYYEWYDGTQIRALVLKTACDQAVRAMHTALLQARRAGRLWKVYDEFIPIIIRIGINLDTMMAE